MVYKHEKKLKWSAVFTSLSCLLLVPLVSQAAASIDTLSFKPANDQGLYLTVEQSQTLGQWGFAVGATADYSSGSLDLKNSSGAKIQDVIDKELAVHLGAALGLADWLNIGAGMSGTPYQQFTTPVTLSKENAAKLGDILLEMKIRLANNKSSPIGLALVPFVTFPTGSDEHFVGNGKVTGGGKLVLDTAKMGDRVSLALNAGSQFRDKAVLSPAAQSIAHQFLYGAGLNVEVAKSVQFVAEVNGWTPFNHFFASNNRNLELDGALKFLLGEKRSVQLAAGGGMGLQKNVGVPVWRAFATIAYHRPTEKTPPAPVIIEVPVPYPVEAPKEEVISTQDIHFAFNKAAVRAESYSALDKILVDIQNRPEVESVRIEGHTDSVGADAYNQKLSEERANAVRSYFVNKGYPTEKLTAVGKGETAPVADNTTKTGRAQNRRVEFHLQLQPGSNTKVEQQSTSPTYEEGDKGKNK